MASAGGGQVTVTRRLMKPGQWSLRLKPGTPKSVMSELDKFDHVVITRTRLIPVAAYTDANILGQSLYTGVIESLSRTANTLAGFDLSYWLGTPDGRGDLLDTAVTWSAGTLSQWVGDLRPSSIAAGTVTNTGTSAVTNTYQYVTRREALDDMCRAAGAEWRVNPDFTLDAALPGTLFAATPSIVITRRNDGNDGEYRGMNVADLATAESVSTYVTKAIVIAQGAGATVEVASSTGSTSYKDGLNNALVMEALVNAPADASPAATAAAVVAERNADRRELTLSSDSYNVSRFVEPGDWVYVWDEQADLVGGTQITYNGRLITPLALRVHAITFPVEQGMGVYVRRSGSTPSYTDVSDWVEWETSATTWEVGASSLPLSSSAAPGAARLGVNPAIADRLSAGPEAWVTATLSSPWANYGGGWADAAVRKVGDDVEIRGLVYGGTEGTAIMVLAAGYRPIDYHMFATVVAISGDHWGRAARLDVLDTGEVRAFWGSGTAAYLSVCCRFSTA